MSRLICFFSVGTQARPVTYTWDGRSHHSPYVIDAALKLDIVSRNTDQIVFAPILTKETRGQIGQDMRTAVAIAGDTWAPIEVDSTGEEAVEHVIGEMLQRVQDGDRVFVEPTNGPRPFQMALLAGALYLRALRTEVSVERLVYGEFQGGAIYDMSFVLDLFDWTRAAHAFTDALSAGPLLARLRTRRRTKLDELEVPLAGGLTPQLFTKLRGLKVPEAQGLAEREALRLVGRRLKKLKGLVDQTKEDTLNLEWLDAELVLIEEFARAGRLGDATRALREWSVNVVLLGMGGTEKWNTPKAREPAEDWLSRRTGGRNEATPESFEALLPVYDGVQQLRNPLSHSGYQGGEKQLPPLDNANRYVKSARTWWDQNRTVVSAANLTPPPPKNSNG